MGMPKEEHTSKSLSHALEITLTGNNNRTLRGHLNLTALGGGTGAGSAPDQEGEVYDSQGAATFIVVVILVYGLSIVLMIGSLAKKNMKIKNADAEEKQTNKYLNLASDLKEKGAKENYRKLKRNIISIVNQDPEVSDETPSELDFKSSALRSLIAVGSPWVAKATIAASAGGRRVRTTSGSETLHVLIDPPDTDGNVPAYAQHTDDQVDQTQVKVPLSDYPEPHFDRKENRTPSELKRDNDFQVLDEKAKPPRRYIIPIVIISDLDGRQTIAFDPRTGPYPSPHTPDSPWKVCPQSYSSAACTVEDAPWQEKKSSRRLSVDDRSGVWPHHSSRPDVPSSSATSTPGSIGYESFQGTSPTHSASPVLPTRTPSPLTPRSSHIWDPKLSTEAWRSGIAGSRSSSPRRLSWYQPQPVKASDVTVPGFERSSSRNPDLRDGHGHARGARASSPNPNAANRIAQVKALVANSMHQQPDSDDEELVQITSV